MIENDSHALVKLWNPWLSDVYWHDFNGDGRMGEKEVHFIPAGEHWPDRAANLLRSLHSNFSGEASKVQRYESLRDYFDHPEKKSFALQLMISIGKLEAMPQRPGIYSELLEDLRLIQKELQYTRFQYQEANENNKNTHASYDIFNATVSVKHNPPTALLIHEMDHAVTNHVRTQRQAIEDFPKQEGLITSFEFYLDYPLREDAEDLPLSLRYDSLAEASIFLYSPDPDRLLCPSEISREASLANEVHAFQVMARYWLFQLGVQEEDLNKIREGGGAKSQFLQSLRNLCLEKLQGMAIPAEEAYAILLHYFDEGGWINSNLIDYVEDVYEANEDPRFVTNDDCIERPEQNSGCGFSW